MANSHLFAVKFLSRESSDKYLDPETIAIKKLEHNSSLSCLRRIQVDFNDLCLFYGSVGYQATLHWGKYTISHMAIAQVPLWISNPFASFSFPKRGKGEHLFTGI